MKRGARLGNALIYLLKTSKHETIFYLFNPPQSRRTRIFDRLILRAGHFGNRFLLLFNLNFNRWQTTKHATNVTGRERSDFTPTRGLMIANLTAIVPNATDQAKLNHDVFLSMRTNNYEVRYYNVCSRTFKRTATKKTVQAYDQRHALQIIDRHQNLIISIKKKP